MAFISYRKAIEHNLSKFFTGHPCPYGHVAEQYTDNWACVECEKIKDQLRELGIISPKKKPVEQTMQKPNTKLKIPVEDTSWSEIVVDQEYLGKDPDNEWYCLVELASHFKRNSHMTVKMQVVDVPEKGAEFIETTIKGKPFFFRKHKRVLPDGRFVVFDAFGVHEKHFD